MKAFRALIEYRCFEPESSFTVPIKSKNTDFNLPSNLDVIDIEQKDEDVSCKK
jgi:hypothetical protein